MHRKIGHILVLGFLGRKSGGDIAYALPPTLKSGGGARPPRPPPIDAHAAKPKLGRSESARIAAATCPVKMA